MSRFKKGTGMGMIEMKFYEDGNKAWQKLKGENMEHKLCKTCENYWRSNMHLEYDPARHCHHEKEKPKEKCWCEYSFRDVMVSAWFAHCPVNQFIIKFCPVCGRKLEEK